MLLSTEILLSLTWVDFVIVGSLPAHVIVGVSLDAVPIVPGHHAFGELEDQGVLDVQAELEDFFMDIFNAEHLGDTQFAFGLPALSLPEILQYLAQVPQRLLSLLGEVDFKPGVVQDLLG